MEVSAFYLFSVEIRARISLYGQSTQHLVSLNKSNHLDGQCLHYLTISYRRHVFGDLRPYTCLFSGCMESNTDFDRRHRWQLHVLQYHWRSWFCPFKCEGTFPSKIELSRHIGHQHMPNAPDDQVNAATALGEKSASDETVNNCPLCAHAVVGLKPYVKHVGRHLEQLALRALPSLDDENSEDGGDSDEQNSAASEANFGDENSSYAPSTSPSLRRRLDEPEAVFAEITLKRDDEVDPGREILGIERLGREFGTSESSGDGWEEAQHDHTTEGDKDAAEAEVDNSLAHHSSTLDPQQPVSNDMISPTTSMQTQMHQLSPEDKSKVTELALRMMSNASERTKAKHRAQIHQILPQHQREELQAQGKDLALWFYENQSLQLLEANTVQPELESFSPSEEPSMPQEQHGYTGSFISEGERPVPVESGQDIPIQVFAKNNEAANAEEAAETGVVAAAFAEVAGHLSKIEFIKMIDSIKRGLLADSIRIGQLAESIKKVDLTDLAALETKKVNASIEELLARIPAQEESLKFAEAQIKRITEAETETSTKHSSEMAKGDAAQQEYERRLEDGLRRSGVDDLAIGAILTMERAQHRENKETILEGEVGPEVEVPPDMIQKGTEHKTEANPDESKKEDERLPIEFKDAVGRKFSFPFHLCQTWQVRLE